MDFIERLFGFSPDGGDGSTELLWLGVLALGVLMVAWFGLQRQRARRATSIDKR